MTISDGLRKRREMLSVGELAKLLALHPQTVYGFVREQRIPHVRIASKVVFDPSAIADWIDMRTCK